VVDDRKVAISGIILFVIGAILFFVAPSIAPTPTQAFFALILPTVTLLMLGWGLTFAIAMRRGGTGTRFVAQLVIILLLFNFANFYLSFEHAIHLASGIAFGLPHEPPTGHVMLGFVLLVITMVITSFLALRKGSTKPM